MSKVAKHSQIAIRLETRILDRADALIPKLSKPGLSITRTDVLRMAVSAGIEMIEVAEKLGGKKKP